VAAFRLTDPATAPTDQELIDRTLAGDGGAYGILVERFQRKKVNSCSKVCGSDARPGKCSDLDAHSLLLTRSVSPSSCCCIHAMRPDFPQSQSGQHSLLTQAGIQTVFLLLLGSTKRNVLDRTLSSLEIAVNSQ
jgi:hypothetical protein